MTLPEAAVARWPAESLTWPNAGSWNEHPALWPHDSYYRGIMYTPERLIELGYTPGATPELAQVTGQPYTHDGNFRTNEPGSLLHEYKRRNFPKTRWGNDEVDRNAFDSHAIETALIYPKPAAWVEASLTTLDTLREKRNDLAPLVKQLHSYNDRPFEVYVPAHNERLATAGPYAFHPILDAAYTHAPITADSSTHMAFHTPGNPTEPMEFQPLVEFVRYVDTARQIAKHIGGDIGTLIDGHLSFAAQKLARYLEERTRLSKNYGETRANARAWYYALVYPAYDLSNQEIATNNDKLTTQNILWGAALTEQFLFFDGLYQDLSALGIPTSRPIFHKDTRTLRIHRAFHMTRSIQAIIEPSRKPKPISITLSADTPLVTISGNNEGKTFTQQAALHALYESLQGRFPLAKRIETPVTRGMFAIPAELPQEVGESGYTTQLHRLISFTSSVQRIRRAAPEEPIVLLADELFAGTDEQEAAALFRAFMSYCTRHGILVQLSTNNEQTYDPDRGKFATVKNRKLVALASPDDIVTQRRGIPLLATAGMPQEVIAHASQLVDILPSKPAERRRPNAFESQRLAQSLALLQRSGRETRYGENLKLLYRVNALPLFDYTQWLNDIFASPAQYPLKETYRQWWKSILPPQQGQLKSFFEKFASQISQLMSIPDIAKRDSLERDHSERILNNAREWLQWAQDQHFEMLPFPTDMRDRILIYWDQLLETTHTLIGTITDVSDIELSRAIVKTCMRLDHLQTRAFDEVSGYFLLSELFEKFAFCNVIHVPGNTIDVKGVWSTSLMYELASGTQKDGKKLVANDVALTSSQPNILLGSNKSGKTCLLEALEVATFFAMHFNRAPATSFILGEDIQGVLGLTDYTRDPQRPKDSGKWLTRQSQIADILAATENGGYAVFLDEADEGTNGIEGRATLIAIATHLVRTGNMAVFSTHKHKAVDILAQTIGVNPYASGLGPKGRFSFAPGRASSLGIAIAGEEGLPKEILEEATRILSEMNKNQQA